MPGSRRTRLPNGRERPPRKPGAFRALRNRNFRLFWIGQLVSLIGTWAQNLAQGWLIVILVDPSLRSGVATAGLGAGQKSFARGRGGGQLLFRLGQLCAGGLPIFPYSRFLPESSPTAWTSAVCCW